MQRARWPLPDGTDVYDNDKVLQRLLKNTVSYGSCAITVETVTLQPIAKHANKNLRPWGPSDVLACKPQVGTEAGGVR